MAGDTNWLLDQLRLLLTKNIDLKGRRVTNAGKSVDPFDYVRKDELSAAIVSTVTQQIIATPALHHLTHEAGNSDAIELYNLASSGTVKRIPFISASQGKLTDDSDLTFDTDQLIATKIKSTLFQTRNAADSADIDLLKRNTQDTTILTGKQFALADTAVVAIGDSTLQGQLTVICEELNSVGIFGVSGAGAASILISDPFGVFFDDTAGTAGLTNVYWNGGSSKYEIQNLTGGAKNYRIVLVGRS